MAATFIKGLVIKQDNTVFLDTDLVNYGQVQILPTPGAGGNPIDGNFWAIPIVDEGIVGGFRFEPKSDNTAPTPQSFEVFRLRTSEHLSNNKHYWYVRGNVDQYVTAAAQAENGDNVTPLPLTVPPLSPEYDICGGAVVILDIPAGTGNLTSLGGYVTTDGNYVTLPVLPAAGAATPADLAGQMTTAWASATGATFSGSADGIVVTFGASSEVDSFSASLSRVAP